MGGFLSTGNTETLNWSDVDTSKIQLSSDHAATLRIPEQDFNDKLKAIMNNIDMPSVTEQDFNRKSMKGGFDLSTTTEEVSESIHGNRKNRNSRKNKLKRRTITESDKNVDYLSSAESDASYASESDNYTQSGGSSEMKSEKNLRTETSVTENISSIMDNSDRNTLTPELSSINRSDVPSLNTSDLQLVSVE